MEPKVNNEITNFNADDLDVEELEHRIELVVVIDPQDPQKCYSYS